MCREPAPIGPDGAKAFDSALPTVHDDVLRANVVTGLGDGNRAALQTWLAPVVRKRPLEDHHLAVRISAARVLGTFTNAPGAAAPELVAALKDAGVSQAFAVLGLGRFGSNAASAVPAPEAALPTADSRVRAEISTALAAIRGPE